MINQTDHYVAWASLLDELDEAKEHLMKLTAEMAAKGRIDDAIFAVDLGHVFAHLNRAWHTRNLTTAIPGEKWSEYSGFPSDLQPAG